MAMRMFSAQTSNYVRSRGISLPDMAPLAGVLLVVMSYFLLGRFQNPTDEIVALDCLPATSSSYCKAGGGSQAIISLDAANRLAFSVTSSIIQTSALEIVALQHGIRLTPAQLTKLANIAFLNITVENLPAYLGLSVGKRHTRNQENLFGSLSEKELIECIIAAKTSAKTEASDYLPICFALRIASDVKMKDVNHLIDLLQAQGINRFNLVTRFNELKR